MPVQQPRSDRIAVLRASVEAVSGPPVDHGVLAFGIDAIDDRLAHGGLTVGGLHEVAAATTALGDDAAATLFVGGIAARFAAGAGTPVLWATTRFDLYAPGLEQAGLGTADVLFAQPRDETQLLAVLEDAVRDGSPALVIAEVRRADMIATRRLQLAAGDRVYAFCTTEPNPLVAPKHPKAMPVILLAEDHDRWLRGGVDDVLALQAAYPSQLMRVT